MTNEFWNIGDKATITDESDNRELIYPLVNQPVIIRAIRTTHATVELCNRVGPYNAGHLLVVEWRHLKERE